MFCCMFKFIYLFRNNIICWKGAMLNLFLDRHVFHWWLFYQRQLEDRRERQSVVWRKDRAMTVQKGFLPGDHFPLSLPKSPHHTCWTITLFSRKIPWLFGQSTHSSWWLSLPCLPLALTPYHISAFTRDLPTLLSGSSVKRSIFLSPKPSSTGIFS